MKNQFRRAGDAFWLKRHGRGETGFFGEARLKGSDSVSGL